MDFLGYGRLKEFRVKAYSVYIELLKEYWRGYLLGVLTGMRVMAPLHHMNMYTSPFTEVRGFFRVFKHAKGCKRMSP